MKYFSVCGEQGELLVNEISEAEYLEMSTAAVELQAELEHYVAPKALKTVSGVEIELVMIGYEMVFVKAPDDWVEETIVDMDEEFWELWDQLGE